MSLMQCSFVCQHACSLWLISRVLAMSRSNHQGWNATAMSLKTLGTRCASVSSGLSRGAHSHVLLPFMGATLTLLREEFSFWRSLGGEGRGGVLRQFLSVTRICQGDTREALACAFV